MKRAGEGAYLKKRIYNNSFLKTEMRQKKKRKKRIDGQEKGMKKWEKGGARRTRVRQGVFLALRRTIKRKTASFRRRSTLFYAMTKHRIMLTF